MSLMLDPAPHDRLAHRGVGLHAALAGGSLLPPPTCRRVAEDRPCPTFTLISTTRPDPSCPPADRASRKLPILTIELKGPSGLDRDFETGPEAVLGGSRGS
jgi:hypothetical protein